MWVQALAFNNREARGNALGGEQSVKATYHTHTWSEREGRRELRAKPKEVILVTTSHGVILLRKKVSHAGMKVRTRSLEFTRRTLNSWLSR